jgi:chitinase
MWELFGPVSNNSSPLRPFGTAVIDGFDFDFENLVMNNMPTYANQLRSLYSTDTSKTYYMTAAPQCAYPDTADDSMLDGAVYFDAIFVQFYNNACGLVYFDPSSATQRFFNFNTWDNWAKNVSKNPNVKVYMGIEGNVGAGAGYEGLSIVEPAVTYVSQFSSFGGVMMWDASQVWSNTGFLSSVYKTLPTSTNSSTTHTLQDAD